MLSIIAVILGLGAIILVHELGHFLTARVVGIPVERFSIGFPPHFLKIKGKSTEYCLGVIPLGGYVKIQLGIDGETTPEGPWYSRMAVVFGGPFFNFLFAGIVFVLILGFIGQEHAVFSNVVGNEENALGLAKSDTILAVNTIEVIDYSGVAEEMEKNPEGVILVGTSSGRISLEYSFSSLSEIPGFEPFMAVSQKSSTSSTVVSFSNIDSINLASSASATTTSSSLSSVYSAGATVTPICSNRLSNSFNPQTEVEIGQIENLFK